MLKLHRVHVLWYLEVTRPEVKASETVIFMFPSPSMSPFLRPYFASILVSASVLVLLPPSLSMSLCTCQAASISAYVFVSLPPCHHPCLLSLRTCVNSRLCLCVSAPLSLSLPNSSSVSLCLCLCYLRPRSMPSVCLWYIYIPIGVNPGPGVSRPPDFGVGIIGWSWGSLLVVVACPWNIIICYHVKKYEIRGQLKWWHSVKKVIQKFGRRTCLRTPSF